MSIFISGCSSGIGFEAAIYLKSKGYDVIATARSNEALELLCSHGLKALRLDVTQSDSIKKAVDEALSYAKGGVDVLINNAGFGQVGALEDLSSEALKRQFDTNVFGLHALTNAFLPHMLAQKKGRIINISSILGIVSLPLMGAYNASKYAVEGLSDTWRLELADTPIHVSLVEPGPIESKFRDAMSTTLESVDTAHSRKKEAYEQMAEKYRLQKKNPFMKSPQAVIDKIVHAIESPRPKARYKVTTPAHLLSFLKRVLTTKQLDWVLRKA